MLEGAEMKHVNEWLAAGKSLVRPGREAVASVELPRIKGPESE